MLCACVFDVLELANRFAELLADLLANVDAAGSVAQSATPTA